MTHKGLKDKELYDRFRNGDIKSFDVIFDRFYPALCAYGAQYVSVEDAENIVQDVMLWLWENRDGMMIVITVKRDASPQIVLNQLYSFTQMQTTFGVIMLAIVNGEPKTLTLKDMLQHYIDFQVDVVTRRTQFDLKKAEERARVLVSEAEIVKAAQQRAGEIVSAAQTEARTVRQTVTDYCDNMLKTTEETMAENAAQVKNVRANLRQTPRRGA